MAVIKKYSNFMGLPMNVARGNPIPLDKSEIWYSYESMAAYAATDPVAYVGQILGLVDETNSTATAYIILNTAGDLQEIGASIEIPELKGDNASIVISSEDVIALKNWGVQYYKYVEASGTEGEEDYVEAHYELQVVDADNPWIAGLEPKVTSENNQMVLAWYQPNPTTIEGLGSQLSSLQTSVSDLQTSMGNVYTKKETDEKIAAAAHLKRQIVDSIDDINKDANDADQIVYMVPVAAEDSEEHDRYDEYMVIIVVDEEGIETRFIEKVGSWEVDLSNYVTDDDLQDKLDEKVSIVPGHSLISAEDLNKLVGIEAGAQKNYIASVDGNNFAVDEAGKLSLKTITISQVSNLETLLNGKVDKEEGKGLSSNDLTDELLNTINSNQQSVQVLTTTIQNLEALLDTSTDEEGKYVSGTLGIIQQDILTLAGLINTNAQNIASNMKTIGELSTSLSNTSQQVATNTENIGIIQKSIGDLTSALNNYVTIDAFEETVGTFNELKLETSTIYTQVKELQEALTWGTI